MKNANACKIFVVAKTSNSDAWYGFDTVASTGLPTTTPTTSDPFIWTDASAQSGGSGSSKDFPYSTQIDSTTPTLSIQNLNALMTVPAAGTNGVYDCMDIRDYYGQEADADPVSTYYAAAVGTGSKILINNFMLTHTPTNGIPLNASDLMKTQFFNWGINDPGASTSSLPTAVGTQTATNYPQLNKNKVLVVYRNQQTVSSITKNAYRYVIVNALTAAP